MKSTLLLIGLSLATSAFAALDTQALLFTNLARDARDRAFTNEVELGHAQVELLRARHTFAQDERLLPTHSISTFEWMDAALKLMRTEFDVKHLNAVADELKTEGKSWELQAARARGEKISAKALAQLYVELRERHFQIAKDLLNDALPFAAKLTAKSEATKQLLGSQSVSIDEAYLMTTAALEGEGLVEMAKRHVEESRQLLEKARADWSAAAE